MKYCASCGNPLPDEAGFCSRCGTSVAQAAAPVQTAVMPESQPAAAPQSGIDEEKTCLDTFYRFLKYERLAWKIGGFVFIALSALYILLSGLYMLLAIAESFDSYYASEPYVIDMITYFITALIYLPAGIVGLKASSRVNYYMDTLYSDVRPTVDRCSSIGMIVFCAIFNEIALAFFLVNFVRAKTCKNTLQQIIDRQQNYHGRSHK